MQIHASNHLYKPVRCGLHFVACMLLFFLVCQRFSRFWRLMLQITRLCWKEQWTC